MVLHALDVAVDGVLINLEELEEAGQGLVAAPVCVGGGYPSAGTKL